MNKHKNIISNAASALLALAAFSMTFTSCSGDDEPMQDASGKSVEITVGVTSGNSIDTRTNLEEGDDRMACTWAENDKLLVTDTSGEILSTLSITEGVGKKTATFTGTLSGMADGTVELNFTYLGASTKLGNVTESTFNVNLAQQDGLQTTLNDYDIMSAQANVIISGGSASIASGITLNKLLAIGHFTLKFPEGVSITDRTVVISGDNLKNATVVNLSNGSTSGSVDGNITIERSNGDFYLNLIPATGVAPKFTVTTEDGVEYEGTLAVKDIKAGDFICGGNKVGVSVEMNKVGGDEPDPNNPGDTGSWGGDNVSPEYTTGSLTKVSTTNGWTVNSDIYDSGGFGTKVTYKSNGIYNNLLVSNSNTAYYFQWGRWLGFPSTCGRTVINSNGSADGNYPNASQSLLGISTLDTSLGYIFNSGLAASYAACYMGNSSWTRQRTLNSSIMFGMVSGLTVNSLDYIGANENCTWSDRSGNPCPIGYRVPTAAELETLIPTSKSISGSYAEIKTVDGIKYAMEWKVNTSNAVPCVEIRSVRTTAAIVSAGDPVFNDAKVVKLHAYGYLNNEAELSSHKSTGVYWSCESGSNTINGTKGYGGKYLEVNFKGTVATMAIGVAPRSFAAPVLLIKDETVTEQVSITPWLPLSGI